MVAAVSAALAPAMARAQGQFQVEEASIADIHGAIQTGRTTCRQVVEAYLARTKAYNGACTALVTRDGAPVPAAQGAVRAGKPIAYPTETMPVSKFFPDFDEYEGPPFEFGRMEPSISDSSAYLQTGMRAGIPDAGQLNALETLNVRGERSITCKGEFDRAPSAGPLPQGAPAACEEFRKLPDALEHAATLDRQYGRNPDLDAMPMYCVVFSLKNWFDAKDMRSTGGNDVNFAMDAPKSDSPDIAELRRKGAIIFAVATASNVGGASASGPKKAKTVFPMGGLQFGLWGGQACNPYDTARVPRGTSNGSGVSVGANLVTCSICEQGTASCKGPASRNNVVNILTTKGVIQDGGIGNKKPGDRAGIHCKTVEDAALVLDAIKGYESEDTYTALPQGLIPAESYSSVVVPDSAVASKPLKGVRIGVAREYFVKHTKNDEAISDQIDEEIKKVLRDKLGAELVESVDPMHSDDPTIPNMKYTFQDAFAEILPHHLPEYFWQTTESGELEFAVPGWDVRSVDYTVALATGKAPLSEKINLRSITERLSTPSGPFVINKYLRERGDARVKDWGSWVANAKFKTASDQARAENAVADQDARPDPDRVNYLVMRTVLRMVILKVMYENDIDVFVNPEQTTPPYILGGAAEPEINGRASISCCTRFTAILGAPEVEVPAGYVRTTYDPQYVLSDDKKEYIEVTGTVKSQLPYPMPTSLMVWAGPGSDADTIKVASAYEAATHHRIPPPAFGPLSVSAETSGF
jgi:Asp-tRNA(Asn)/Glu-tRNA(Gln) amidotransferase A subunit family amidase